MTDRSPLRYLANSPLPGAVNPTRSGGTASWAGELLYMARNLTAYALQRGAGLLERAARAVLGGGNPRF